MMHFSRTSLALFLFLALTTPILAATNALTPATTTQPASTSTTDTSHPPSPVGASGPSIESLGLSSCFDYYRFGSVPAVISPSLNQVSQAATVGFLGTLTNENEYPITDVTVYVKIFRSRGPLRIDANGPDVVAFFPVVEHLNLKGKERTPITFTWKVPADSEPGDYQAATFVVANDRFEMTGLVFTDDVIGNTADFKVSGESAGSIRFKKDAATINNVPYHYAAFPPTIPGGVKDVPISSVVTNTTQLPYKGTVTWSTYYWDPVNKTHLLDTKTEEIKIHPGATTTASYVVTDTAHSVYYVEGVLHSKEGGAASLVGMRFVRSDVAEPRFNFVGISKGIAVACIHSTGTATAKDGEVTISVTNNDSSVLSKFLSLFGSGYLAKKSYKGAIPGSIAAVTVPLSHTASSYLVTADLYQAGKHLDSVSISYSCKDLGVPCPSLLKQLLIPGSISLALIVLIVLAVWWYKRRQLARTPFQIPHS